MKDFRFGLTGLEPSNPAEQANVFLNLGRAKAKLPKGDILESLIAIS